MIINQGYPIEEHKIKTEDQYILTVNLIFLINNSKRHGGSKKTVKSTKNTRLFYNMVYWTAV